MLLSYITTKHRQKKGFTLEKLAEKSDLSKGFLSRLENGEFDQKNVSLATIIKLADGLSIEVKEILDLLDVTKGQENPPLQLYLKRRYKIEDDRDYLIIENLINHIKRKEK